MIPDLCRSPRWSSLKVAARKSHDLKLYSPRSPTLPAESFDIPYWHTIRCATSVARSISLDAGRDLAECKLSARVTQEGG